MTLSFVVSYTTHVRLVLGVTAADGEHSELVNKSHLLQGAPVIDCAYYPSSSTHADAIVFHVHVKLFRCVIKCLSKSDSSQGKRFVSLRYGLYR
jgi:hypothetical protein